MVNSITPIHEPANTAGEVMRHDDAMKQDPTVFQFQSI
jgi:hypothetical protein